MSVQFLTESWFDKIQELRTQAGDIEISDSLKGVKINVTADGVEMCLNEGFFEKGHDNDAPATLIVTKDLAYRLLIENDQSAGMQGFMSGELRVEGDMSQIMSLQTVQPSDDQKALQAKIQEVTEV